MSHQRLNAKQWTQLNQLRSAAFQLLSNRNRAMLHRATNKDKAKAKAQGMDDDFSPMSKHIKNRNITALDETICDFVVEHVYNIENESSPYVQGVMTLYETVTAYRL